MYNCICIFEKSMIKFILTFFFILFIGNAHAIDPVEKKITYDQFQYQVINFKANHSVKSFHFTSINKYGDKLPFTIIVIGFLIVPDIVVLGTATDNRIKEGALVYDAFAFSLITYYLIEQYYY